MCMGIFLFEPSLGWFCPPCSEKLYGYMSLRKWQGSTQGQELPSAPPTLHCQTPGLAPTIEANQAHS